MSGNAFFYPIVALSVALAMNYVNKGTGKNITPDGTGKYFLRVPEMYRIVGYVSLLICAIMVAAPLFVEKMDVVSYLYLTASYLVFGGLGLLSVLYYRNHHAVFDTNGIQVQDVFRVTRFMRWEDITKAGFNPTTSLITFKDKTGNRIRLNQHLIGLGKLLALLEEKTEWTAERLGLPVKANK